MSISQGDDAARQREPAVRYVAPLRAFGRRDLAVVGGKAAGLGELIRAGMPVPDGYVLTTSAYRAHLWAGEAQREITALAGRRARDASAVHSAIMAAEVPAEVAEAIRGAYRELGGGPIAVRSSATTEDLPTAAFAGQQDTYLDVRGEDEVVAAVRRCWASLWGERAVEYRARQGFSARAAEIAVVLQRMVPAEIAGVLLTANPVTGVRGEVVLDAAPGLGEAVVSGLVAPDHYVLAKRGRRLTAFRRGSATGSARRLSRREVVGLVRLGGAVERIFGAPQDIEWAVADGRTQVLQSRPLTALPEPPARFSPSIVRAEATARLTRVTRQMIAELAPVRPYPIDDTTWSAAVVGALGEMAGFLGVRLPSFDQLVTREDGVIVRIEPRPPRPTARLLLAPGLLLGNAVRYDPLRWRQDPAISQVPALARSWEARNLRGMPPQALLELLDQALRLPVRGICDLRVRYLPRGALAALALIVLAKATGYRGSVGALLAGTPTLTSEANDAVDHLADRVRADPALAARLADVAEGAGGSGVSAALADFPVFAAEVAAVLDRFGHRESTMLLMTMPTWRDAPEEFLALIAALAAGPSSAARPSAADPVAGLLAGPVLGSRPIAPALRRLVAVARTLFQVREDTHFLATASLPTARRVVREFGGRLVGVGIADAVEDVYHLRRAELDELAADWPPTVAKAEQIRRILLRRKEKRAELADRPYLHAPPPFAGPGDPADVLVRGMGASAGVAEGTARVVLGPAEFGRLGPGEILVAPFTTPSWTPLFQRAAAVVADAGGPASHAAITAREYGIPAVLGADGATRLVRDGQRIRVDGRTGLVTAADTAPGGPAGRANPDPSGRRPAPGEGTGP